QETLPQANAVGIVGADGTLINTSRGWPVPALDVSDREHFLYLRDHNDGGVFVSAPQRARLTGEWTAFFARRVSGPRGEFLGILVGSIEAPYFEEFYKAINPKGGSVAIFRRDGTLIARFPHLEDKIGEKLPASSPWYDMV